jgi:serine protease AprX
MGPGSTKTQATLWDVRNMIQVGWGASASLYGAGVGVALIDTGVAPVPGLPASQIINGPDLSFESQSPDLRYLDTYGHGTHMAGIIVGNDPTTGNMGLAWKSKLTSIKVGTANGTVDVSQVIAAIDWVVKHKNDDPANPIRVINLSYGTGGNPSSATDPVQFAVEQAWKAGIVVVVAAGNDASSKMSDPATDPYVLAVGSAATNGTPENADDKLSAFNNGKAAARRFDVLAPGESVLSMRDPGSSIDAKYPGAVVNTSQFRGSGTSQATAVVSGAVALLVGARPSLTPDQVKQLLVNTGTPIYGTSVKMVSINAALAAPAPWTSTPYSTSTGTGRLEDARGALHVTLNGVVLSGENSIFGPFSTAAWAPQAAAKTSWVGGVWMGKRFAGDGWTGTSWASKTWAPATWPGVAWNGGTWIDPSWAGHYWSGHYWSGQAWSGHYWSTDGWATGRWG